MRTSSSSLPFAVVSGRTRISPEISDFSRAAAFSLLEVFVAPPMEAMAEALSCDDAATEVATAMGEFSSNVSPDIGTAVATAAKFCDIDVFSSAALCVNARSAAASAEDGNNARSNSSLSALDEKGVGDISGWVVGGFFFVISMLIVVNVREKEP